MNRRLLPWWLALQLVLVSQAPLLSFGEFAENKVGCNKAVLFAPEGTGTPRQYAPDRDVEVLHIALDVTPDFQRRSVSGTSTLRFRPVLRPLRELKLDAVDLEVAEVTSTEKVQAYQATKEHIIVTFQRPIPADQIASVTVSYRANPLRGLYFRTPEMGYKLGDTHLFTQGEEIESRHWFPCVDTPNAMSTSEITCHVPEGMTVISNGRLVGERPEPGGRSFRWLQDRKHANYLITLVAGYFKGLEDRHRTVSLAFFTPPSQFPQADNSFRNTAKMMKYFEEETGVPYPWEKYDQVCVNDFVAGGMENTSATTLTDDTLFCDESENIHSSEGLVAHELAHQWFGDLVTCKDWSHTWLNEGFATYFEVLYTEHNEGAAAARYELLQQARMITGNANDTTPIVRRDFQNPGEMFGYLSYQKAGWVLHMLRHQLGKDVFRDCVKAYLERHRHSNVVTEDFRRVIEERTGQSFDRFFDQWLYHAGYPQLDVSYSWDETTRMAKLAVRQTQKVEGNNLLFVCPLTVRFKGPFGTVDRVLQVAQREEDFYLPLEAAPTGVRMDPDLVLLAKINFGVPNGMLVEQLKDESDVVGRLIAVEQLGKQRNADSVARLRDVLQKGPFWGVRAEASGALRQMHTDDALAALLDSTKQPDARVRRHVIQDITRFYRDSAYAKARDILSSEKNPEIVAVALAGLAGYGQPEAGELLLRFLAMDSYQNRIARAAVRALRSEDHPRYIEPLLRTLNADRARFESDGLEEALGTLGYLARNEEDKTAVRDFLIAQLRSEKRRVRVAAIQALGKLGDPSAIGALEKFASASRETREGPSAELAITELRAARRPIDDFKNLREEVTNLKKENRDLKTEVADLKRQFDALKPVPAAAKKQKAVAPLHKGKGKS